MRTTVRVAAASAYRPPCKRKLELDSNNVGDREQLWRSLGVPPQELNLGLALLTGQTFLWKQTRPDEFTGVVGSYLVSLKQTQEDVLFLVHSSLEKNKENQEKGQGKKVLQREDDEKIAVKLLLKDFFTLGTLLAPLWQKFSTVDQRFAAVAPYFQGARLLRQPPVECVFQFICSSNNHIQRITRMVNYLASHGCWLGRVHEQDFFAFPTLEQLSKVTEEELRQAGFGYRAKYITGAVQHLAAKPGGGEQWLHALRSLSLEEATASLCTLPGIGPKVAACVALFSLDKHHAIPVDTHVWQIAVRHLTPELASERLSPRLHHDVAAAFVNRFGEYAGWAQTVLFIAELASHQSRLPTHLRLQKPSKSKKSAAKSEQATTMTHQRS